MGSTSSTEVQALPDEEEMAEEPGPKEKMPAWLAILIGTFTALLVIWLLFVIAYPSLA